MTNEIHVELHRVSNVGWRAVFSEPVRYKDHPTKGRIWDLEGETEADVGVATWLATDRIGAWLEAERVAKENGYTLVAGGDDGQQE